MSEKSKNVKSAEKKINEIKISKRTLDILKNFSSINLNLYVEKGNKIRTVSEAKNIIAITTVPETFPVDFAIWNLQILLGTFSLFDNLKITFEDKFMLITEENGSSKSPVVKFFYADPSVITKINNEPSFPESESNIEFEICDEDIERIKKAASILSLDTVVFHNKNGKMQIYVIDEKSSQITKNTFSCGLTDTGIDNEMSAVIKIANLRFMESNYKVTITDDFITKFVSTSDNLVYYVANETKTAEELGLNN